MRLLGHKGQDVVDYWREMVAKNPDYGPSCDHGNGAQVINYIDQLLSIIAERERYTKHLSETIQFNRDQHDKALALGRQQQRTLRARIAELEAQA